MRYYVLKDEATGFGDLLRFPTDEYRLRVFEAEFDNEESMINKYRKDYSIWCVGDFNTDTGEFLQDMRLLRRGENYKVKGGKNVQTRDVRKDK